MPGLRGYFTGNSSRTLCYNTRDKVNNNHITDMIVLARNALIYIIHDTLYIFFGNVTQVPQIF